MKNILTLILCVLILFLVGCGSAEPSNPEEIQTKGFILGNTNEAGNRDVENYFYYVQDSRTRLCFVTGRLSAEAGVLSHVPCTPEVMTLIQNPNAPTGSIAGATLQGATR